MQCIKVRAGAAGDGKNDGGVIANIDKIMYYCTMILFSLRGGVR